VKIKTGSQPWGSALLATLLTVFIVAMALASFLTMVSVQHQSTLRSQSWNSAVPAMEAGVEEALTQIYHHGTTNFSTSDGWRLNAADGFYHNIGRLKIGDSKEVYSYDVGIKPPTVPGPDQPVIECLGYAPAPLNLATSYRSPYGMILGGLVPTYSPDIPTTKRKVRVIAKRQTPVSYAMLAKGQINMNGNNIATDSFDSAADPFPK